MIPCFLSFKFVTWVVSLTQFLKTIVSILLETRGAQNFYPRDNVSIPRLLMNGLMGSIFLSQLILTFLLWNTFRSYLIIHGTPTSFLMVIMPLFSSLVLIPMHHYFLNLPCVPPVHLFFHIYILVLLPVMFIHPGIKLTLVPESYNLAWATVHLMLSTRYLRIAHNCPL